MGLLASEAGLGSRAASGSDTDFQTRSCITRPLGNEGNFAPMESPNSSISVNSGLGTSQVFAKSMQNVKSKVVNQGILKIRNGDSFKQ